MSLPKREAHWLIEISDVDDHITLKGIFPDFAFDTVVKEDPCTNLVVIPVKLDHDDLLKMKKPLKSGFQLMIGCQFGFKKRFLQLTHQ
jgi:hypothetical protein